MKRSILHTLRGRMIWLALACAAGTLAAQGTRAADAAPGANQLQSINVQALNGNQTVLTLHMSGPAPEPLVSLLQLILILSLERRWSWHLHLLSDPPELAQTKLPPVACLRQGWLSWASPVKSRQDFQSDSRL